MILRSLLIEATPYNDLNDPLCIHMYVYIYSRLRESNSCAHFEGPVGFIYIYTPVYIYVYARFMTVGTILFWKYQNSNKRKGTLLIEYRALLEYTVFQNTVHSMGWLQLVGSFRL